MDDRDDLDIFDDLEDVEQSRNSSPRLPFVIGALVVVGLIIGIVVSVVVGGFTTIAFLPDFVQNVARAFPTYYSVEGVREVLFYDEMPTLGRNLLVLSSAAVVSLVVGAVALGRPSARR